MFKTLTFNYSAAAWGISLHSFQHTLEYFKDERFTQSKWFILRPKTEEATWRKCRQPAQLAVTHIDAAEKEEEREILEACKTQTRSLDVEKWAWLEIVFGLRRRQRCWQTFPCGSGACELKTHWAQSIITRPRYISATPVAEVAATTAAVAVTAAAVACHWARSACRQESSAATIFFNFPQQSSVDNKLMRVALTKVLLFSLLLLLHLNYARPQRECHSSSFMLAEWYITHTSCAPLCRNSLLDESNGGDGEKSSKGCKFFLHVYSSIYYKYNCSVYVLTNKERRSSQCRNVCAAQLALPWQQIHRFV